MVIFNFDSISEILNCYFLEKKKEEPDFSIRLWAYQLGMKSHGTLQQAISGKKPLPHKYFITVANSMDLTYRELQYFEALMGYERAEKPEEKDFYETRKNETNPLTKKRATDEITLHNNDFWINPLNQIIYTLAGRSDFQANENWIQTQLNHNFALDEIEQSLIFLNETNLINTQNGAVNETHTITADKSQTRREANKIANNKFAQISAKAVLLLENEDNMFRTYLFNIKKSQLNEAIDELQAFQDTFMNKYYTVNKEGEETYQLGIQFFPLTK